jgi:SapC
MTTAFFYQQPEILDRDKHQHLKLRTTTNARFAAQAQNVPVVAAEFADAALEYPLVFVKAEDGQWVAMALTGLNPGKNLFVKETGQWDARYVPASVRRYPFILAANGSGHYSVAVDLVATTLGSDGQAIFNEAGEPTEATASVMALLESFQIQAAYTHAFAQRLFDAGLLVESHADLNEPDGSTQRLQGFFMVDETQLKALPDDQVLSWFRNGELTLVYLHLASLKNLSSLQLRRQRLHTLKTQTHKAARVS